MTLEIQMMIAKMTLKGSTILRIWKSMALIITDSKSLFRRNLQPNGSGRSCRNLVCIFGAQNCRVQNSVEVVKIQLYRFYRQNPTTFPLAHGRLQLTLWVKF